MNLLRLQGSIAAETKGEGQDRRQAQAPERTAESAGSWAVTSGEEPERRAAQ